MTKQAQNSSINPEQIKPEVVKIATPEYVNAWRSQVPFDSTQIRQKIKIGSFTMSATWAYYLNIGYIPSLLQIRAFDDWHAAYSESITNSTENHCIYHDSWGNYWDAGAKVVYLDHGGLTTAVLAQYWPITQITCDAYNHEAKIHWIAHP